MGDALDMHDEEKEESEGFESDPFLEFLFFSKFLTLPVFLYR
jgi:hypothetical protein